MRLRTRGRPVSDIWSKPASRGGVLDRLDAKLSMPATDPDLDAELRELLKPYRTTLTAATLGKILD